MDISEFGKGLLPDPPDSRDFKIESLGAAAPVDWNIPYSVPEPRQHNQEGSDACGPYATSSYHETIKPGKWFSRRDLAARVLLPNYGSYLRDNILAIVNQGQATQDEVPDPAHPTAQNMRDKTGVTLDKELDDKELSGFSLPGDIDSVARTIRDYQGCLFGLYMSNGGWNDQINPRPPLATEVKIGHALYGMGYHLHDGQKCIIAHSSFGNSNGTSEGTHHHIKENYFLSGNTFNPWTLIPKGQAMNQAKVIKSKNSLTVYVCYPVPSMDYLKTKSELEGFSYDPANIPSSDTL